VSAAYHYNVRARVSILWGDRVGERRRRSSGEVAGEISRPLSARSGHPGALCVSLLRILRRDAMNDDAGHFSAGDARLAARCTGGKYERGP